MSDRKEQLETLRTKLVEKISPLADNADIAPEEKFTLLLTAARYQGDPQLLEKAFAASEEIVDTELKTAATLDLLDEVELQIGEEDNSQDDSDQEPADEVQSQNHEGDDHQG